MTTIFWAKSIFIWGVIPILPTLPALLVIVPLIAASAGLALVTLLRPATLARIGRLAWRQRWAFTLIAFTISIACWVMTHTGWSRGTVTSQSDSAAAWPMYRGNLNRLGAVAGGPLPMRPQLVWTHKRLDEAFYSSPAVSGDRIYAVGSRGDEGRVYCFDAHSGEVIWNVTPPRYRATFASPVVVGQRLVCGEGLHHARLARVICLDLRPGNEGELVWSFSTRGHVECTPFVANDRVYVGAGDDGVYCLELDGAADGKPKQVWHVPGSQLPDVETSLAVHQGRVYVGLGLHGNALCVLDAATGRELKRIAMPYPVFSPPAIHDGKLYVGMGVGDYVTPQEKPVGRVCCIDLGSLEIDWHYETGGTILGAVAASDEGIYFASADGRVTRLDLGGHLLAAFDSHAPIIGSPALAGGVVFVVNGAGKLYALGADRLGVLWQQTLGTSGRFVSSPAVAHGHVYVGTEHNGLVCAGRPAASDLATIWPSALGGAGFAGCRDGSQVPRHAQVTWHFPEDERNLLIVAPVAPTGDRVLVPVAKGDYSGLIALNNSMDAESREAWSISVEGGVWSSPAIADNRVFFIEGGHDAESRLLHCVRLDDAERLWTYLFGKDAELLLADEHSIVMRYDMDQVIAIDHSGKRIWQKRIGLIEQSAAGNAAVLALANQEPPSLLLLDRPTGRELWRCMMPAAPTTAPVIVKDSILLGTTAGLFKLRIEDGSIARRNDASEAGVVGPMLVDAMQCIFITANDQAVTASTHDLQTFNTFPLEQRVSNYLLTSKGGVLVTTDALVRFNGRSRTDAWFELADVGSLTNQPVLHQGRLYFATTAGGLMCLGEDSRR